MKPSIAMKASVAAGFVLFTVGALRELADPAAAARGGLMPVARAAEACPTPKVDELARDWVIVNSTCTECRSTHLQKGDRIRFARDLSGAASFSAVVTPGSSGRKGSLTEGYSLVSDGVGNVTGPIVLGHDPLDGSPLQLHWLIVKIRSFDSDGLGSCALRGRLQVCDAEPGKGATSCTAQQHAGEIHIEPSVDPPPP